MLGGQTVIKIWWRRLIQVGEPPLQDISSLVRKQFSGKEYFSARLHLSKWNSKYFIFMTWSCWMICCASVEQDVNIAEFTLRSLALCCGFSSFFSRHLLNGYTWLLSCFDYFVIQEKAYPCAPYSLVLGWTPSQPFHKSLTRKTF